MGAGTGGETPVNIDNLKKQLSDTQSRTVRQTYESEISIRLQEYLAQYNSRDVSRINSSLRSIVDLLQSDTDGTIDLRLGGSILKHTYVDGLSDVDCLVLLKDPELGKMSPRELLEHFKEVLTKRLKNAAEIKLGDLAVTISYPDGLEIQLLPAIKKGSGYVISARRGDKWSSIIRPDSFAKVLTEVNQACNGMLVPTIKLAKVAVADFPERYELTGYHIEAMAIEIFKSYSGPRSIKSMLEYFFDKSKDLVLKNIRDKTGQSINVDDYLGPEGSEQRTAISNRLNRVLRRMKNANATCIVNEWLRTISE